jgi:hypothetical protein
MSVLSAARHEGLVEQAFNLTLLIRRLDQLEGITPDGEELQRLCVDSAG